MSWATRGLFIGERHVYLCAQIDDLFLASAHLPGTGVTYRITDADMQALADWQSGAPREPAGRRACASPGRRTCKGRGASRTIR